MDRVSIALVDEMPFRRASIFQLLSQHIGTDVRCFGTGDELAARASCETYEPACIILCTGRSSPIGRAIPPQLEFLRRAFSTSAVVILSDDQDIEAVSAAFRHGAHAYIPTSLEPELVLEALQLVLAGGTFFPAAALSGLRQRLRSVQDENPTPPDERWSQRQRAVLRLLAEGKANKEIARALAIEESAVKARVRQIMRKLGVANRTQVALQAQRFC
jgi:DNA-binding NarL/FixJ family response regulator